MQKRALETKQKILTAASQEFSANGFHGGKIDTIAEQAGVNKQRIYAYYKSKENLFAEVLKNSFQTIIESEQSFLNLSESDIPRLAEILLNHYFSFHESHPEFWRLIAWENLAGGKHTETLRGIREKTFQHLRVLYQTGQQNGIYDPAVSFETFIYVLSALSFFYYSNRQTMTQTLSMNLQHNTLRDRIKQEILILLAGEKR